MVDRPQVGVAVLLTRGTTVLLVKRRHVHGDGTWGAVGGHLDQGESPDQCAIREVKEETGLDISTPRFVAVTNDVFEDLQLHYITLWFEVEAAEGEPTAAAAYEMEAVAWFSWDDLPSPLFLPFQNLLAQKSYMPPPSDTEP